MVPTLLIAGTLLLVILFKTFAKSVERCPDCGQHRQDDAPICACGWVFEYPENDEPIEYGDPDEHVR